MPTIIGSPFSSRSARQKRMSPSQPRKVPSKIEVKPVLSAQLQALGRPPLPPRGSTAARMPARIAASVVVGRGLAAALRPPAAGSAGAAPRALPVPVAASARAAAPRPASALAAAFCALVLRTELGRMPICEPVVGPQAMKGFPVIRLPSASRGASGVEGGIAWTFGAGACAAVPPALNSAAHPANRLTARRFFMIASRGPGAGPVDEWELSEGITDRGCTQPCQGHARKAPTGSTREARRAGRYVAIRATVVKLNATRTYVTGSVGLTPNRSADMTRVIASA